jgi:hypothetical protein
MPHASIRVAPSLPPQPNSSGADTPDATAVSALESLLKFHANVYVSVNSPATYAVQRLNYIFMERDIESEAQLWLRYTQESCYPISVILQCYGHNEAFNKLAGMLFDARQNAAARVCNVLAEIRVGQ